MLLFIGSPAFNLIPFPSFQYISCCYLSNLTKIKHLKIFGFNTSHVVIYLQLKYTGKQPLLFQYISCCYLSAVAIREAKYSISFNTSHVVIYRNKFIYNKHVIRFQYISCCYLSKKRKGGLLCANVSIHLMLLFITI